MVTGESYEIPVTPWTRIRGIRVGRIRGRGARIRRRRRRIVVVNRIRVPLANDSRRTRIKQRWGGRHVSAGNAIL